MPNEQTKIMKQSKIKKTYDKEADQWEQLIMQGEKFYQTNKLFFELLKKKDKKTVLDMGCGIGLQSIEFAKRGFKVLGLDFSKKMIAIARRNQTHHLEFIQSDVNKFKSAEKFGGIWACCSLHNMDLTTLKKTLLSLNKLLQNEGVLCIKMRRGSFEGEIKRNNISRYYRYSNPREIKKIATDINLRWIATKYSKRFGIPFFTIYFEKKEA